LISENKTIFCQLEMVVHPPSILSTKPLFYAENVKGSIFHFEQKTFPFHRTIELQNFLSFIFRNKCDCDVLFSNESHAHWFRSLSFIDLMFLDFGVVGKLLAHFLLKNEVSNFVKKILMGSLALRKCHLKNVHDMCDEKDGY